MACACDPAYNVKRRASFGVMRSMAKKQTGRNYLLLRDESAAPNLGLVVAEHDEHLQDYYVAPERYLNRALNVRDPSVFFIGPKGIGKSAILQMARLTRASEKERTINISPDDLAFSALANIEANSPILQDAGRNQWLFKSLWEYTLAVEILRREYPSESAVTSFIKDFFRGDHERQARDLVQRSIGDGSQHSFSERILELIREVELAGEYQGAKLSGKAVLNEPQGSSTNQMSLLILVNSVSKHVADNLRHPYFILIDDLDLHWSDTPIQNAFIAALFFALRHFNRPPNLKCVVAIRDQIYRRLPLVDRDKFHDCVCHVTWDVATIKKMIQQRLVMKLNCQANELWGSVFPQNGFDRMWKHTNGRPREAIRLAATCIDEARSQDHTAVQDDDLVKGIRRFSDERITDLANEYKFHYDGLEAVTRKFTGWPKEFPLTKLREVAEYISLEIGCDQQKKLPYKWAANFENDLQSFSRILFETGVLLVKANRTATAKVYDLDNPVDLTDETWVAIHPMYAAGLELVGA